MKRSWPAPAEASAAARAAMFCSGMWSTVTLMPFLLPHSCANLSNHLSKAGTKWLHWMIVSVLVCARAREMNGDETAGAPPAARPTAALVRKLRRVIGKKPAARSLFIVPLPGPVQRGFSPYHEYGSFFR